MVNMKAILLRTRGILILLSLFIVLPEAVSAADTYPSMDG
jgi:hypothetical protein